VLSVQHHVGGGAAVDFGSALSIGFYRDGRVPDGPEGLREAAKAAGIDREPWESDWSTAAARARTQTAFARARGQGVGTYPSLFLRVAGDGPEDLLVPVMAGWAPPEAALAADRQALHETRAAG